MVGAENALLKSFVITRKSVSFVCNSGITARSSVFLFADMTGTYLGHTKSRASGGASYTGELNNIGTSSPSKLCGFSVRRAKPYRKH